MALSASSRGVWLMAANKRGVRRLGKWRVARRGALGGVAAYGGAALVARLVIMASSASASRLGVNNVGGALARRGVGGINNVLVAGSASSAAA